MTKLATLLIIAFLIFPLVTTAQEEVHITAEVVYPTTTVYAAAGVNSPQLGELVMGDQVIVLQREGNYIGSWVRVTAPDKNLTGWVDGEKLYFSQANWKRYVPLLTVNEMRDAAYVENDTLPLPLETALDFCYGVAVKLRAEPFREAQVLAERLPGEKAIVTALAMSNGVYLPFVRVFLPESGLEGWAWAECVGGFGENLLSWINVNLPVVSFDRPLTYPQNAISELEITVTEWGAYLRPYPVDIYWRPNLGFIPVGTKLLAIERSNCELVSSGHLRPRDSDCWLKVTYNGEIGWVWGYRIELTDDILRLPYVQ